MNGVLLVDKPAGITSHTVVSKLRKKLQTKKIGHAGTLDPSATGLMVVCVGQATKISGYVIDADKTYQCRFVLGKTTTTYDEEGEIVSEMDASAISKQDLERVFGDFVGHLSQRPPIYSAIKIKGKKLYQYARSNTEIEIPVRDVTIHSLKLLSYDSPVGLLEVACSKGTYVRSLVHDMGAKLGVGAMVEKIHRTRSSPFAIEQAVSLDQLLEMELPEIQEKMISITQALSDRFVIQFVNQDMESHIRHGKPISADQIGLVEPSFLVFVSESSKKEIAIAQIKEAKVAYLRVF